MKNWNQITHYAGFDWAKDHHDVIVLDGIGKIVADFRFEHTAGGWEQFREKIAGRLSDCWKWSAVSYPARSLRRIETAMQRMELSLLTKLPSSQRSLIADGQPVILEIVVTEMKSPDQQPHEAEE